MSNHLKNSRIKETLKLADRYQNDPDKDNRLNAQKCVVCYYGTFVSGQAFTLWNCAICGKEANHPNTHTPRLCVTCAKEQDLCHVCGADV